VDTLLRVHLQKSTRGPANAGLTPNKPIFDQKMHGPQVSTRLKQLNRLAGFRIDTGKIRPFVTVAPLTR
jgi:hypothetical protein